MIQWCAYCQSYIGECPPWEEFSITHSLCGNCLEKKLYSDTAHIQKARQVGVFYERLRAAARSRELVQAAQVMDECISIGIRPIDLMMGIIQPLLYEIGELWSQERVTVVTEHQFSGFASSLLTMVYIRYPDLWPYRQSRQPRMVLTNAEGNYHVLGTQILELYLAGVHVPTLTILPGIPASEVLHLVRDLKPRFLGISVSIPTQMSSVREVATAVRELPADQRPRIIIGGASIRAGLELREELGILMCSNLAELGAAGVF